MNTNNQKITGVIFDVDGVLLDSVPYHFEAWKMLFNDVGIQFSYKDYVEKVNGLPRLTGIGNIVGHEDIKHLEMLAGKKQNYLLKSVQKAPPKPLDGVISLLSQLKNLQLKLAAASSSKNAPFLLKEAKLASFFDHIISGKDFSKPKPDPEIFLLASKKLRTPPENCIVIEDALLGIRAAKKGRMRAIGLLSSQDDAIKIEADITINSMKEYADIINYIMNSK